jgi:hypothetical protein
MSETTKSSTVTFIGFKSPPTLTELIDGFCKENGHASRSAGIRALVGMSLGLENAPNADPASLEIFVRRHGSPAPAAAMAGAVLRSE